jgi:hypothetical protein
MSRHGSDASLLLAAPSKPHAAQACVWSAAHAGRHHASELIHQIYQREKVEDVAQWRDAVQFAA